MNPLVAIVLVAAGRLSSGQPSSIRSIDIISYLKLHEPHVSECETAHTPSIIITFKQFADVDDDGIEEMIIVGRTCYSGSGGPDLLRVYKRVNSTELLDISPSDMIKFYKGKEILASNGNWSPFLEFKNGHLLETFSDRHGVHGEVTLYFKWKNDRFELVNLERSHFNY